MQPNKQKVDWSKIKHFTQKEIRCKDCGMDAIDHEIMLKADEIRTKMGQPLKITSGVRCTLHNAVCGGARQSYHMAMPERGLLGQALDIKPLQAKDLTQLHEICLEVMGETGGVILEPSWVHIDTRSGCYRATSEGKW